MTPEALAEIRERADKATPGPWLYRPRIIDDWGSVRAGVDGYHVAISRDGDGIGADQKAMDEHRKNKTDPYEPNGRFIAHARTDIPALLALVEAKQAEVERLRNDKRRAEDTLLEVASDLQQARTTIATLVAASRPVVDSLRDLFAAIDKGALQMSSEEQGDPESGVPYHPWHDEWLHYARRDADALAAAVTAAMGGK
jgi:hypothetical protein